jgi:hypothetical protein
MVGKILRTAVVLLAVATVLAGCHAPSETPEEQAANALDIRARSGGEEAVRSAMRDPKSVEFKDERVLASADNTSAALCGQVNANNGMGGKTGFQPFIWSTEPMFHHKQLALADTYPAAILAFATKCGFTV